MSDTERLLRDAAKAHHEFEHGEGGRDEHWALFYLGFFVARRPLTTPFATDIHDVLTTTHADTTDGWFTIAARKINETLEHRWGRPH